METYTAEDYINFIKQGRRDKISPNALEIIAKRFDELNSISKNKHIESPQSSLECAKIILSILEQYLVENPCIRFSQALFNLRINQFANSENPEKENLNLRDIYNDTNDEILKRIKNG